MIFPLLLSLALGSPALLSPPADSTPAYRLLCEMAIKRAQITALSSRFRMDTISPDSTEQSTGELLYIRPQRIIFRIEDKSGGKTKLMMVVDRTRVYEYDPAITQLSEYDRKGDPNIEALFAAFEQNPEQIEKQYALSLFTPEDAVYADCKGLILRPANNTSPSLFREIRLYLDEKNLLPVRIHLVNDEDSSVDLLFDRFTINPDIKPEDTQIIIPRGTTIVHDDRVIKMLRFKSIRIPAKPLVPKPAQRNSPDSSTPSNTVRENSEQGAGNP